MPHQGGCDATYTPAPAHAQMSKQGQGKGRPQSSCLHDSRLSVTEVRAVALWSEETRKAGQRSKATSPSQPHQPPPRGPVRVAQGSLSPTAFVQSSPSPTSLLPEGPSAWPRALCLPTAFVQSSPPHPPRSSLLSLLCLSLHDQNE